mmetsp:Transcript_50/g.53  ORF Transcript_50/g.53 Transcript_50/m.53 type:complete len:186 (+) Transcript_50:93-650(+)
MLTVTTGITGIMLSFAIATKFQYLSAKSLVLSYKLVKKKRQFHRLFTCLLCFDHFSMSVFIETLLFWQFSTSLEMNLYRKQPIRYVFALLICGASVLLPGYFFKQARYKFMADIFVTAITTWWSRVGRDQPVSFYGFTLRAAYFPFAMLCVLFLYQGEYVAKRCLLGIVSGLTTHAVNSIFIRFQ